MSMSRKHLEPIATAIGRACLDANVERAADLPEPARTLAAEMRTVCAMHADNFNGARFDAWVEDVAALRRHCLTGARITAAPARRAAVSA